LKSSKPALSFVFVTMLLDVLGFSILIPVGPRLVQNLLGPGTTDGQAAVWTGYLAATYAAMQFIFSPILGALSDRFGRRPVLLIALLGSGLDYFAMALAPSLGWFFVTRVINGISGATMTVANAYIADVTPPDKRAAGYGVLGAAFGIGFIIGPLLGGVLGKYDLHLPFYVAGGVTLVNWLYGCFVLPESLPPEKRGVRSMKGFNPFNVFSHIARNPLVAGLSFAMFFLNVAMFCLHGTWVMYTKHRYGFDAFAVGLSLCLVGLMAAIVQGVLAKRIIPALGPGVIGERRAVLFGIVVGTCAYVGYGVATEGWMIYAILAVASVGGIAQPAIQALITRSVKPTEQGETQGAITGLTSIATIIAFFAGPAAFEYGTAETTKPPFNLPGLSYFLSAALCVVGGTLAYFATRRIVRAHATTIPGPGDTPSTPA
jgi:DHA1 family tetracycline resistance protein-like MFS transporter